MSLLDPPYLQPSPALEKLFNDLVKNPCNNHTRTPSWKVVLKESDPQKRSAYHRVELLDQGRVDFDNPPNGLQPEDAVLLYCYHYMLMHFISSYKIFEKHQNFFRAKLGTRRTIFIDFGCGPLTSGLALKTFMDSCLNQDQSQCMYIGIDRSQAMLSKAKEFNSYGSYLNATFLTDYKSLTPELVGPGDAQTLLVFNFCYFLAAHGLQREGVYDVIKSILQKYSQSPVMMIYQNPPGLSDNTEIWTELKNNFSGFKSCVKENEISYRYKKLDGDIHKNPSVFYDVLYDK